MNTREQFGKYLLLKKLTEDPLGETFRAGLLGSNGMERVALLRIFNGQGLDGQRLWQAVEGRTGIPEVLKSPNIGDGIELGQIEGIPYVAYDYISGKNMANLLEQAARKRNFIPAEHALLITERIALGLASAAETRFGDNRLLHGFLAPHLIIISNEGETKLLGFEVGPGLRSFAGNPVIRQHFGRYLAPEALAGAAPDRIDDVYSLGVMLHELLTGRPLPPPAADGFGSVIDQATIATEGTPIAPELKDLLKQSLVARDHRIRDAATWHKTLNKYMFEGQYNPTTFNLAFFMHNLFRQEIERESQEIEVEKTLPLLVVKPEPAGTVPVAAIPAAPSPPPQEAPAPGVQDSTGVREGTASYVGPPPEKKSKTGLILGIAALLLLVALGGWFFTRGGGNDTETVAAAAPPPPPPPAEPEYTGPSEEELQARISELISQESQLLEEQYQSQLTDLQNQLKDAEQDAERRRTEAEERAQAEAEQARLEAEAAAAEEQRLAEEAAAAKKAEEEAAAAAEEAKLAAAAPPPAAPRAPQVRRGDLVEAGPGVKMPELVRRPRPRYPEMARRFNKKSATVLVRVLIDENGRVTRAELAGKEQKFGFDTEALRAAEKSVYKPATKDGVPVKIWHTIAMEFRDR
ncbi:MAG: TonB family protein [Acidobacteriota bacterium]